jgi:hypothetical protein
MKLITGYRQFLTIYLSGQVGTIPIPSLALQSARPTESRECQMTGKAL